MFHSENNNCSEIFSLKFSIIKTSFVLNVEIMFSFKSFGKISKHLVFDFKIDAKCDFPEPDGPNILTILFIHFGQLLIKSKIFFFISAMFRKF